MACSVAPALPHQMFNNPVGAAPHPMTMWKPPPPAEDGVMLSDFTWIGYLGGGGLARVFEVRHRRTGAVSALKVSSGAAEFGEEAEVLRRAAGWPHVVACRALLRGPAGERACVLELMDAGCLRRVLDRRRQTMGIMGGIPESALAEAAAQCAAGLAQLHARGVTHLDVKPDNFLANSRGEIKIGDFNLSRIIYAGDGKRPLVVPITSGTRCYFSPERFAPGARAGPQGAMAADVWGLGVTVLELFLGQYVVSPELSYAGLELAICHEGPRLRVPEEAEASPELRSFVAACLQREPASRATVPQLLGHPFITRRDLQASRRQLRGLIAETCNDSVAALSRTRRSAISCA
ncbi:unnamed protein product [Urochloa humidicola]